MLPFALPAAARHDPSRPQFSGAHEAGLAAAANARPVSLTILDYRLSVWRYLEPPKGFASQIDNRSSHRAAAKKSMLQWDLEANREMIPPETASPNTWRCSKPRAQRVQA